MAKFSMFSLLTIFPPAGTVLVGEGKIALTGHPVGNPEVALWHRIKSLLTWAKISGFITLNSGLWPEKIMTEVLSTMKQL